MATGRSLSNALRQQAVAAPALKSAGSIAIDRERITAHVLEKNWLPWVALGLYASFLFVTLPDYGVTWDEVGWFRYGYQQWEAILHGTGKLGDVYAEYYPYGSLPPLAAAATNHLFYEILHWVSPAVGYHIANVGFAILLAVGILVWAKQTLGIPGATLALLLWMVMPRLWPDAHYNISDLPGAAGCLWTAWAAWRISRAEKPLVRDYLSCGLVAGIAFTLRAPNVYFLAIAILFWIFVSRWIYKVRWPALSWWGPVVTIAMFFVTVKVLSPPLWHASVFKQVFWTNPEAYLFSIGKEDLWFRGRYFPVNAPPIYYAPWTWLISTPFIVIVCWAVGARQVFRRYSELTPALLLWLILWLVAVFKHAAGSGNYDGVRHFLEAYAPMTLLAAHGALVLWRWLFRLPLAITRASYAAVALGLALPVYTGWRIHPYQSGYFNALAGPLPRAWQDYEVEYWGQSYLPASKWIEQHVDPDVALYAPDASHIAKFYLSPPYNVKTMTPYWEFPDFGEFRNSLGSFLEGAPRGSVLMNLNRPRLYRGQGRFTCPNHWETVHKEGPDPELPPMMILCRKAQQEAIR